MVCAVLDCVVRGVLFEVDRKLEKRKQSSIVERPLDILGRDHKKGKELEWGRRLAVVTMVGTSFPNLDNHANID